MSVEEYIKSILGMAREDQIKILEALEKELRLPPPLIPKPTPEELDRRARESAEDPSKTISIEDAFMKWDRAARGG